MKSIRTDPINHAGKGDERIRTAVPGGTTDSAYVARLERALAWFAEGDSWGIANYDERAFTFNPPDWTACSTPWGVARAALASPEART